MEGHTMDVLFSNWDPNDPNAKLPSEVKCFQAYVDLVQQVFNTQIWGSDFAPTHWNMPVDPQKRIILTLCLDNECCKAAIENIDTLLKIPRITHTVSSFIESSLFYSEKRRNFIM
jgi:hypothetical protein